MESNKHFSENWIIVFGIFLICITYYKYENDPTAKSNTKIKEATVSSEKKVNAQSVTLEFNRNLASDKTKESNTEIDRTANDGFNPSVKFNKAAGHAASHRKPAQNITGVSVSNHALLQNTKWKLWANTQVIKNSDLADRNAVLAQVSNLAVVESSEETDLTAFDNSKPIAVFDERLKKPGILTGIVKVQTNNKAQLQEDLKNMHAEISDEFESIQTYFVKSQSKVFNLEALFENLKAQDYIFNVELEVIDRSYNKN